MRTSLNEIRSIDEFLLGKFSGNEKIAFQNNLSTDPNLYLNILLQKKIYHLVQLYHQLELKNELKIFHHRLLNDPGKKEWRNEVELIFTS